MLDKVIIQKVNQVLSNLYAYVEEPAIKPKFEVFIKQEVHENINSQEKLLELIQAFLFDYKIDGKHTLLEHYLQNNDSLPEEELELLTSWKNSIHSIFEIEKVTKDSFISFNLVNEKEYTIKTLVNFLNYRGIGKGDYIFCRIAPVEDYHVLIGNLITFPKSSKKEMYEMATMVQIENPVELYRDNSEKLEAIYEDNAVKFQKFYDLFGTDEVFTSGENINDIITAYTEYVEFGNIDRSLLEGISRKTDNFYFSSRNVQDHTSMTNPAALISEFAKYHDAGIIVDEKEGLYVLPYYGTFVEIFANPDFRNIKEYKECIMFYLEDDATSPSPFAKAITRYPENSVNVFKDVLDVPDFSLDSDFDDLMEQYKYDYMYNNRISQVTVFDHSMAFRELVKLYEEMEESSELAEELLQSTGRNDPCPCGSGKKFKKCCLSKIS